MLEMLEDDADGVSLNEIAASIISAVAIVTASQMCP